MKRKAKVRKNGEVIIPKVFREKYKISPGDIVFIKMNNQSIIIELS